MPRERLVVLMGAGSTAAAGAPSTQNLTEYLGTLRFPAAIKVSRFMMDASDKVPHPLAFGTSVCELLWRGLKAAFQSPNFEHLIHALELLEPLARPDFSEVVDEYRPVLTAFMEVSRKYQVIFEPNLLDYCRHSVMKAIVSHVLNQISFSGGPSPERELANLCTRLGCDFDLSVFTLNYDDLIDRTGTWFDGFIKPCDPHRSPTPLAFDRRTFIAACQSDPRVMVHLHGSIRFGYSRDAIEVEPRGVEIEKGRRNLPG